MAKEEGTLLKFAPATEGAEALAHLLACLDGAAECLRWCGRDIDAKIVEAHRAQLVRGREWPGDPVTAPDLEA